VTRWSSLDAITHNLGKGRWREHHPRCAANSGSKYDSDSSSASFNIFAATLIRGKHLHKCKYAKDKTGGGSVPYAPFRMHSTSPPSLWATMAARPTGRSLG